jgi:hypothetical protein
LVWFVLASLHLRGIYNIYIYALGQNFNFGKYHGRSYNIYVDQREKIKHQRNFHKFWVNMGESHTDVMWLDRPTFFRTCHLTIWFEHCENTTNMQSISDNICIFTKCSMSMSAQIAVLYQLHLVFLWKTSLYPCHLMKITFLSVAGWIISTYTFLSNFIS